MQNLNTIVYYSIVIMICLDTREGELIQLLGGTVKQLPVGDIWIGDITEEEFTTGLIIERKSMRDFEASILDGRYREQRGRILAFCQEHIAKNNSIQPMYIIEGSFSSATGRLQKSALMKFMNRLVLRYQIPVMQTASVEETAELVIALVEQWKEDPTALQRTTELVKVADGLHVQKKVNSLEQFGIMCIAQCPGVSVKMAEALIGAFGSLKGIMNATVKEIEMVKVGNRKVGPVVSKRLSELLQA